MPVLSFVGTTLYAQSISAQIDDAARSISGNAMLSIEHLTDTEIEKIRDDLEKECEREDGKLRASFTVDKLRRRY